ncbi:hypothetical protein [Singulisphaera sp. PoT]|uniref:hypothetical protein n=1 Tax=Singulisphaera sp. PoT TaxID=3411797 RepID=UPI003BF4DD55
MPFTPCRDTADDRSELRIKTTRCWSKPTDLRAIPYLFGLYSVATILYAAIHAVAWPGEAVRISPDALSAIRHRAWAEGVFVHVTGGPSIRKLPSAIRGIIYAAPAPPAQGV